jgi:hypothetical protein
LLAPLQLLLVCDVPEMSAVAGVPSSIANTDAVACLPSDVACTLLVLFAFLKIEKEVESEKLN